MLKKLADLKIAGFQIKLGASIRDIIRESPRAMHFKNIKDVYNERNYVLVPDLSKRKMLVLIKDMATTDDILCAYFHAVLLSIVICAINDEYSVRLFLTYYEYTFLFDLGKIRYGLHRAMGTTGIHGPASYE